MKLEDVRRAFGEVVRAATRPAACPCPRHRLTYRPPDERGHDRAITDDPSAGDLTGKPMQASSQQEMDSGRD